eukprot:TRINITY_DN4599_c0_g1_i1.p1 TRINITY_DN4599_c0_g1~~TRINITY_DN4599_c0_g1_i1.p1  ORF type:complete len:494 (+),score=181.63 TRINITY_DN4599_c0_g1_i1:57-1538(+)
MQPGFVATRLQPIVAPPNLSFFQHPRLYFARIVDQITARAPGSLVKRAILVVDDSLLSCDLHGGVRAAVPVATIREAYLQSRMEADRLVKQCLILVAGQEDVVLQQAELAEFMPAGALEELLHLLSELKRHLHGMPVPAVALDGRDVVAAADLNDHPTQTHAAERFDRSWVPPPAPQVAQPSPEASVFPGAPPPAAAPAYPSPAPAVPAPPPSSAVPQSVPIVRTTTVLSSHDTSDQHSAHYHPYDQHPTRPQMHTQPQLPRPSPRHHRPQPCGVAGEEDEWSAGAPVGAPRGDALFESMGQQFLAKRIGEQWKTARPVRVTAERRQPAGSPTAGRVTDAAVEAALADLPEVDFTAELAADDVEPDIRMYNILRPTALSPRTRGGTVPPVPTGTGVRAKHGANVREDFWRHYMHEYDRCMSRAQKLPLSTARRQQQQHQQQHRTVRRAPQRPAASSLRTSQPLERRPPAASGAFSVSAQDPRWRGYVDDWLSR